MILMMFSRNAVFTHILYILLPAFIHHRWNACALWHKLLYFDHLPDASCCENIALL
jgi:hypothetical protein